MVVRTSQMWCTYYTRFQYETSMVLFAGVFLERSHGGSASANVWDAELGWDALGNTWTWRIVLQRDVFI